MIDDYNCTTMWLRTSFREITLVETLLRRTSYYNNELVLPRGEAMFEEFAIIANELIQT